MYLPPNFATLDTTSKPAPVYLKTLLTSTFGDGILNPKDVEQARVDLGYGLQSGYNDGRIFKKEVFFAECRDALQRRDDKQQAQWADRALKQFAEAVKSKAKATRLLRGDIFLDAEIAKEATQHLKLSPAKAYEDFLSKVAGGPEKPIIPMATLLRTQKEACKVGTDEAELQLNQALQQLPDNDSAKRAYILQRSATLHPLTDTPQFFQARLAAEAKAAKQAGFAPLDEDTFRYNDNDYERNRGR